MAVSRSAIVNNQWEVSTYELITYKISHLERYFKQAPSSSTSTVRVMSNDSVDLSLNVY